MREEWKVYIKGVPNRGDEVIKMLEDLGAKNSIPEYKGKDSTALYYIGHNGEIYIESEESEYGKIIMDNYHELHLPEKWKDGDILINNDGSCYKVFSEYDTDIITNFFAYNLLISVDGTIIDYNDGVWVCEIKDYRLATSTEVEHFFDLLHDSNKEWDAENKQLVNWKWKPKFDEAYWVITTSGDVNFFIWREGSADKDLFNFGNCFKTKEEAETMAEKFKKLLKGE